MIVNVAGEDGISTHARVATEAWEGAEVIPEDVILAVRVAHLTTGTDGAAVHGAVDAEASKAEGIGDSSGGLAGNKTAGGSLDRWCGGRRRRRSWLWSCGRGRSSRR